MSSRSSRSSRDTPCSRETGVDSHDSSSGSGIINIITSNKQGINTFANDGSFLELFKKKMEEESKGDASGTSDGEGVKSADEKLKKPESSISVKRRRKVLKTGMVKKLKAEDSEEEPPPNSDAWTRYMAEVKKYKQLASEDDGNRPLVK